MKNIFNQITKIYAVLLLFLLSNCSTNPFVYKSNKINYNMSQDDIKKIMGEPEEKKIFKQKDIYVYYLHQSFYELIFSNKFPFLGFFPLNRTGNEYWCIFNENKKLEYFGKNTELKILLNK